MNETDIQIGILSLTFAALTVIPLTIVTWFVYGLIRFIRNDPPRRTFTKH